MSAVFHAGERAVQDRARVTEIADRVARGVHREIPQAAARFLDAQAFVAVATTGEDGHPVASLLSGAPGIVRVTGPRTLVLDGTPEPAGPVRAALDRPDAPIGLIAIEPATRRRVRINGTARCNGDRIAITTEQVFANCPKYIATREPTTLDAGEAAGPSRETAALEAEDRRALEGADAFFLASTDGTTVDVSHRGGAPGFVVVGGPSALAFPDYSGNSMFMTLGNVTVDPRVGLLVVDWATGDLLGLRGRATIDWSTERAAAMPGAERVVDVAVERVVRVPRGSPLRWRLHAPSRFNP